MKYIIYILILSSFYACNKTDNKKEKAILLLKDGQSLEEQNLPDSAAKAYCQAIDILAQTKNDELLGKIYLQWGDLLVAQGLGSKALQIYEKAVHHSSKTNNKTLIIKSTRNIGKAYVLLDSPKEAIRYHEEALKLAKQYNNEEEIGYIYNNLSFIYSALSQFDKAIEYCNMSINVSKDSVNLYKKYSNKGLILIGLKQYDSAWHYATLGSQSNDLFTKASCYRALSQLSSRLGKSDSTRYMKLSQKLNDSLRTYRDIRSAAKVGDVLHQYEIKESIEKQNEKTLHYYILIAVCGLVVFSLFLYGFKLKVREIDKLKREINTKQSQISAITQKLQTKVQENDDPLETKTIQTIDESNQLQKQIADLINEIGILCAKRFVMSKIYSKTKKQLSEINKVEEADIKEFRHGIFNTFKDYINCLSIYYPKLTQNDHYFCCLFKLKLNISECSALENRTKDVLYTQKSRIKDRLEADINTDYIFNLIFKTADS